MAPRTDSLTELAALELLEAALNLGSNAREEYITARDDCPTAVRERALELLMSDRDAIAGLQTGGAGASLYGRTDVAPDIPGYHIIGKLGHGGMGAVWLGERDAGDFDHKVAIKVIRPGVLSERLIDRFRRERQILAQLNHPHIARLYDGGQTEENQPYIVMEHVAGETLRHWLGQAPKPTLDARLALFRQIAEAVGFAHQNLVIHRDLTPGNVLIDDNGQAKLIDFGIARPPRTERESSAASRVTGLSLTPGFAAPERAKGEGSNTLLDIYSLGRILELMTADSGSREIAAIAACAAAEDPERRYPAVGDLIEDLDRYAEGRAIDSFSTSHRYRAGKFVRRQRVLVASLAAIILALTLGMGTASWSYLRAEKARAQAESRFGEVRDLANFMLYDLYDTLKPVTGNTRSLTLIAERASGYLDTLAREREADSSLALETANGFKRLSDVLGNPEDRNLGQREQAGKALRRSVAMLETLYRDHPDDAAVTRSLANAQYSLSLFIFISEDKAEEAIPAAKRAELLYSNLVSSGAATLQDRIALVEARLQAAKPLVWIDAGPRAIAAMKPLVPQIAGLAEHHPGNVPVLKARAHVLSTLSSAMSWAYDTETQRAAYLSSVPLSNEAIEILSGLHRDRPDDQSIQRALIGAHFVRELIFFDLYESVKADRDLSTAERLASDLLAKDPDDSDLFRRLQGFRGQHGVVLVDLGRDDEAVDLARLGLEEREKLVRREPGNAGYFRDRTTARRSLGEILMLTNRKREGCAVYRQTLAEWQIIKRRWGISALNQSNDVDSTRAAMRDCDAQAVPAR